LLQLKAPAITIVAAQASAQQHEVVWNKTEIMVPTSELFHGCWNPSRDSLTLVCP